MYKSRSSGNGSLARVARRRAQWFTFLMDLRQSGGQVVIVHSSLLFFFLSLLLPFPFVSTPSTHLFPSFHFPRVCARNMRFSLALLFFRFMSSDHVLAICAAKECVRRVICEKMWLFFVTRIADRRPFLFVSVLPLLLSLSRRMCVCNFVLVSLFFLSAQKWDRLVFPRRVRVVNGSGTEKRSLCL